MDEPLRKLSHAKRDEFDKKYLLKIREWCIEQWNFMIEQLSNDDSESTKSILQFLEEHKYIDELVEGGDCELGIAWNHKLLKKECKFRDDYIIKELGRKTIPVIGPYFYEHKFMDGPFKDYTMKAKTKKTDGSMYMLSHPYTRLSITLQK